LETRRHPKARASFFDRGPLAIRMRQGSLSVVPRVAAAGVALVLFGLLAASAGATTIAPAGAAPTGPAFVQQVSAHKSSVSSVALMPTAAITQGNRLVVLVGVWSGAGATAASVTDSAGNSYVELLHFKASEQTEMSVWTAPITSGGGTQPTITVRPSSTADVGAAASEYSGLSTAADASVVDQMAHASGTTSGAASVSSGATPATAAGNELALGMYVDSGFGDTLTAGSGWIQRSNVSNTTNMELLSEDQTLASAGATPNASVGTGANTTWLMSTVVLKAASSAPPTAPAAPTNVSAAPGDGSATVMWSAPADGGSPITSYTVTPYNGSSALTPTVVSGSPPGTSTTIGGLTNGTSYTFTVKATNSVGTGPESVASNPVTPGPQPSAPVIDSSTPAMTGVPSNVTTVTSSSFSPPANSVIYATFAMDSDASVYPNPSVSAVTNTGSALIWHRKGAANQTGTGVGGFVEVWWAYNPTAQSNISVTANLAQPTKNVTPPPGAFGVVVLTGAAADQSSAAWSAGFDTSSGSPPTATVTTTAPNSLVFAAANNWDSAVAPTTGPGQTTTINGQSAVLLNSADQDTYWNQARTAPTATPGAVTMNDTAPSVRYHMVAWEVLAANTSGLLVTPGSLTFTGASGGADPPPGSLSVSSGGSGTVSFSAASDSSWLTVSPTNGSTPQSLTVKTSMTGLNPGTYTGHVTVTPGGGQGSPQVIPVTLIVNSAAGKGDWPTIEHDIGRSGITTDETTIGSSNVSSLAQNWSTALDGKVTAQPLFLSGVQVKGAAHDVVIAATNQNTVYALDANTGAVLWSRHLLNPPSSCGVPGGFGISGTPVVDRASGRIYAVTDDGTLHTLSLADGSDAAAVLQFIANPGTNYVWGGLSLVNGVLYIPTGSDGCDDVPWQGGIYEISVTGSAPQLLKHWVTVPSLPASQAGGGIWGYGGVSVDTGTGHVYAASGDDATGLSTQEGLTPYAGGLLGLDSNLNLLGWYQPSQSVQYPCAPSTACDQDFAATPLIFHPPGCPTMVAAGNKNGKLYATSETNLEGDGGGDGSNVQAIQLNQSLDDLGQGGLFGTPAYSPSTNLLYVVDSGSGITGVAGGLIALSVQPDCSLHVAWSQAIGGSISNSPNSTPTIANGVVYVGANDGTVRAFDAASGTPLWNSGSFGFAVYGAPIVANGQVIAGAWDGNTSTAAGKIRAWTIPAAATVPGAPTGVSASAGNGSATVSWTAPSNGGSPITSYTVTPYIGSTAQTPVTVTGSPPATSTTIAGLTNGTSYTFTVTAANGVGTGPASASSNAVTPSTAPPPGFVQQVAGHGTGSSLTLTPSSTVAAGDRLVVEVGVWNASGATASTVTDSAGNSYVRLLSFKASDGTQMSVWSAPIAAGGGTRPTITVKPTSSADLGVAVSEYSGLSTVADASVVDKSAHKSGTTGGTTATVSSGATAGTTAGNELAIGFYADSGSGDTLTAGSGWTQRSNVSNTGDMELLTEDQNLSAAGATPNASVKTGAKTTWLMATIVLKGG
jgi:hypothetical protein